LLFIQTNVGKSRIHGLGLFAAQFIPKGTVIWKFTPGFDLRFSREQILAFPRVLQIYLSTYAWKSKKSGLYCFASDNDKYCNHSITPNALSEYKDGEAEVVTTAIRDIHKGEEITENYGAFEDEYDHENVLDEIMEELYAADDLAQLAR
jgi:hypothetical protein